MSDLNLQLISSQDRSLLQKVMERNNRFANSIESTNPAFLPPLEIRLLIVADNRLNFSDSAWGLSTFLDSILLPPPRPYLKIRLTVAARDVDPEKITDEALGKGEAWYETATTIRGFRFDKIEHFDPLDFDQVWLFGDYVSSPNVINPTKWDRAPSNAEIAALCAFMDAGGGLFATGDHGGIGSALCGFVPRVRSMRKWFKESGPFGEPQGVPMSNQDRHDTNQPSPDNPVSGSETDDVPQRIVPLIVGRRSGGRTFTSPHPLLLGKNGVIDVMPDHPHEGECILPLELTRTTFGVEPATPTVSFVEFPPSASDPPNPVLPEIVATSFVAAGKNGNSNDKHLATNAHVFGSICVYDGWKAAGPGVGRVVTDATWHHFINLNLVGGPSSSGTGFLASPEGRAHLENIREYYRNLVLWLMPKRISEEAILRATWICLWENRMLENVTAGGPIALESVDSATLLAIGKHSRRVLGDFIGPAHFADWLVLRLEKRLPAEVLDWIRHWPRHTCSAPIELEPWLFLDSLFDFAVGGVVVAIRQRFPDAHSLSKDDTIKLLPELVGAGIDGGLKRAGLSLSAAQRVLAAAEAACNAL